MRPLRLFALPVALSLLLLAATRAQAQATIHVPADQPTIQAGINAANNGDTVLVAPGTYFENLVVQGKNITLKSQSGAAQTIIDGGKNAVVIQLISTTSFDMVVDGFTIRDGTTPGLTPAMGGVTISGVATIQNSTITGNYGYGIYSAGGVAKILNNTISTISPTAGQLQCYIYALPGIFLFGTGGSLTQSLQTVISGNLIEGDGTSCSGSGMSIVSVSPVLIENNILRGNASGIGVSDNNRADDDIHVVVQQNLIYNNETGGLAFDYFFYNGSPAVGEAPVTMVATNNTLYNNLTAGSYNGYSQPNAELTLSDFFPRMAVYNNLIIGNTSVSPLVNCGGVFPLTVDRTPSWFDHNDIYNLQTSSSPLFLNNCAYPNAPFIGINGNISANPVFASATDFHLQPSSPAVDAGNNSAYGLGLNDFTGSPRIQDSKGLGYPVVDMGAYELGGLQDEAISSLSLSSSTYYQMIPGPITLTAVLQNSSGAGVIGPVTFLQDDAPLSTTGSDATGTATYALQSATAGIHRFTASYPGSASLAPALSTVIYVDVAGVSNSATTTSLKCSPNSFAAGGSSLLSVLVNSSGGTPSGSVTLTDNGVYLTTLSLAAGGASYTYTGQIVAGNHILTASYPATGSFAASSASCTVTVQSLPTATTLTINPMTATAGNPVTLGATVAPVTPIANPLPTGSVSFYYTIGSSHSTVALGSFKLTGSGTVSLTVSSLPAGSLHFTCTYSGDATFASSSCTPGSLTITAPPVAPTSLTLGSSANPSADLAPVTFTAQLTGNGTPLANALIALVLNTQSIQLVTDANGSASYTTSTLPIGSTTVTANYAGTPVDAAAAASLVQQVLAPTFDFSLAAANPSITLQTGHHGTLPLTLTSIGGFHGSVSIGCTGQLPPYVTCELPSSMAIAAAASAPVPFTLDTDAVLNFYASERAPASSAPPIAIAMLLPFAVLGFAWRRSSRSTLARRLLALLPVCLLAIGLSGCNGFYPASTPPGTYVISVTATGNSQGSPVVNSHTLQVTLIVTP